MAMAQLLSSATCTPLTTRFLSEPLLQNPNPRSSFLKEKCSLRAGRVSCFVSNGSKKEAMKALENALSQKKDVFENWNNKIEKRGQERQGGGGWYGWFGGDKFWDEAIQVIIVIFGIGNLIISLVLFS